MTLDPLGSIETQHAVEDAWAWQLASANLELECLYSSFAELCFRADVESSVELRSQKVPCSNVQASFH